MLTLETGDSQQYLIHDENMLARRRRSPSIYLLSETTCLSASSFTATFILRHRSSGWLAECQAGEAVYLR